MDLTHIANITESLYLPFCPPSDFQPGDLVNIRPYSAGQWYPEVYRITWIGAIRFFAKHQVYVEHYIDKTCKQMWMPEFADLQKELRHA